MKTSPAYPYATNSQCLKYIGVMVLGLFSVLAIFSPSPFDRLGVDDAPFSPPSDQIVKTAKLSELLAVGLQLTDQAAQVIKTVKKEKSENAKVKGFTKEGVEEPVTLADTKSNQIFVNGYRNQFDGINILSEETEPEVDDIRVDNLELPLGLKLESDPTLDLSEVLIIVDPLDATKEFGEDLLNFVTTMVCVVHEGKPIAGIINQVFEDDRPPVVGVVPLQPGDHGVLFNREKNEASSHVVAISRSHTGNGGNVVDQHLDGYTSLLAGGSGYKSLLVLDGTAEAYVHVTNIKSWDVCANDAVMKASGGDFTDIDGKALSYPMKYDREHSEALFTNGIIATSSKEKQKKFVNNLSGHLS